MLNASGPEVTTAADNPGHMPASCTDDPPAHAGEPVVRTLPPASAYQPALRRWEIRISEALLAGWRDLARREGVGLADLVRASVELVGRLPPGTVRTCLDRAEADRAGDASRGTGPGMPSGDIAPLSTRGVR